MDELVVGRGGGRLAGLWESTGVSACMLPCTSGRLALSDLLGSTSSFSSSSSALISSSTLSFFLPRVEARVCGEEAAVQLYSPLVDRSSVPWA